MTNPPEQPSRPSMGMPGIASGATLPIPGNAEFALFALIEIVLILIWIIAKNFPAIMHLRLYGMNANGKIYELDAAVGINR